MRPTVPEVMPLVHRLYRREDPCTTGAGSMGGHLHIVLDDGNLETPHVVWCREQARRDGCVTCTRLADLMVQMTITQRGRLSDRVYGD